LPILLTYYTCFLLNGLVPGISTPGYVLDANLSAPLAYNLNGTISMAAPSVTAGSLSNGFG
jgi:hypothetical protein